MQDNAAYREYKNVAKSVIGKYSCEKKASCRVLYKIIKKDFSIIEKTFRTAQKLEKLKVDIDPVLMEKYQTRRSDKKFPIIYGVDISKGDAYCPACATGMSLTQINELSSGDVKECETCRKLLYALDK